MVNGSIYDIMDFLWNGYTTPDKGEILHSKRQDMSRMDNFLLQDNTNMVHNISAQLPDGINITIGRGTTNDSFFDTYYSPPRFWTETILAALAALSNITIFMAVHNAKGRKSVYNTLFVNLAVANILSCSLTWLCNNLMFLFKLGTLLTQGTEMCTIMVHLSAAVFVSNSFSLVSTLTMLGFATVQYFAVCRPLHHLSIVRRRRVQAFITISWIMSLLGGCLPWAILLGVSSHVVCDMVKLNLIERVIILGANTCIGVVSAIYLTIIVLCLKIYAEIRSVHRCIMRYRQDRDFKGERRAFITIIILLTTLTSFFIPYTIIQVVSLNTAGGGLAMQKGALIYFMTLMPYCKFLSDPLIYGLRMKEVRDGCLHIVYSLGLGACLKPDKPMLSSNTRSTSFTLTRMNSSFSTKHDSHGAAV